MSIRLLTSTIALSACAVVVTAQSPAPAPASPEPAASSATNRVTLQGCIQLSAPAASATAGAIGTSGAGSTFVLTNAMKAADASSGATAGTSGSSSSMASTYRLDGLDTKLSPHVGHEVQVTGTIEEPKESPAPSDASKAISDATAAPRLKVETVKMVASTCPAK